jgi:hypothetical protein
VRREAIFGAIFEKPRQIFITATELRLPQELAAKVSQLLELDGGALCSKGNDAEPRNAGVIV